MSASNSVARWEAALAAGFIAIGSFALLAHVRYLAPPMVDDAGTSLAYAITLFHGHGLRLTPYSQAVEGFSNPLWVFLCGLAAWTPRAIDVVLAMGIALGVAGAIAASLWGPIAERRLLRVEDSLPVVLCASTTCFAYWISAGLETGLQVLLMSWAALLVLRPRQLGPLAGLVVGLLVLTRPEAILYSAVCGCVAVNRLMRQRRWPVRREWLAIGTFAMTVLAYQALRLAWFASWLPNTYYAKANWNFEPVQYVAGFASTYWPFVAISLVFGIAAVCFAGARERAALALGFAATAFFFAWFAKGDWMREWRFLAPAVPFLGAAAAAGISTLREQLGHRSVPLRWAGLGVVGSLSVLAVVLTARTSMPRSHSLHDGPEFSVNWVRQWAVRIHAHFSQLGIRHALIGTPDLGGNSLTLRADELIDDAGLADYAMARDGTGKSPNHAAREDYLLSEGPPDLVNVHGPSGDLRRYRKLLSHYDYRDGDFVLRGLTVDSDPRCPGGKAAVIGLSTAELTAAIESALDSADPMKALQLWRCAFRYQPDASMPEAKWREAVRDRALARAGALENTNAELALRYLSFATVISGGDAWLRRRTERLRMRVFRNAT